MKDIYEEYQWSNIDYNDYASTEIHSYLNETFLARFDEEIQSAIQQVKVAS